MLLLSHNFCRAPSCPNPGALGPHACTLCLIYEIPLNTSPFQGLFPSSKSKKLPVGLNVGGPLSHLKPSGPHWQLRLQSFPDFGSPLRDPASDSWAEDLLILAAGK